MSTIDLATYSYNIELNSKGFSDGMKDAEGQTEKLKSKFSGLTTFLKGAIVGGLAAVGAAIVGTVVSGVKATADLDEQLSKLQASTGATAEETEEIRKLSQELFKVNTDSMEDIVATAEAMKKAMGLTTDEIKSSQQAFMDYAKTTGQANVDVIQAIDDIGDAWSLSLDEMIGATDMFKLSSEKFGTDLAGVQKAMQQLAPASKALGVSFEETNALMNMMAEGGLDATSAVTALNYAAKTVESPEQFRQMMKDIQAIKDPTERTQKAVELFGARAGVAMSNILDGTKNIDDFIVTMEQAKGTVSSASDAFDSNLNIQLELTKKMFLGLVQELGEKFMPIINEILKWVTANVPIIVGYIENAINFIGTILNPFIELIKYLISVFSDMENSTDSSFSGVREIITSVIGSIQEFIQAFIDVVTAFWDKWGQDILQFAKKYFEALKTQIETVLNIIKGIFLFFTSLLKGDWEGMGNALLSITENIWKLIKNIFNIAIDAIKLILKFAVDTFLKLGKNIMNGLWEGIKFIWRSIIDWFRNSINSLVEWFGTLGEIFANIGSNMLNWLWDGLKSVWSGISNWVSSTVSWLIDKLAFWKSSKNEMSVSDIDKSSQIPKYAAGTPFVPNDQLAFIHAGEMIVPAKYNPNNPANNLQSQSTGTTNTYHINIERVETEDAESFINLLPTLAHQYKR